jgi:hypothetical protein
MITGLRECSLDIGAARAAGQRTPPPRCEAVEDHGGVGGGDGAHLPSHRRALNIGEAMEGPGVEHEPKARSDPGLPHRCDAPAREAHLDACRVHPLLGTVQRLLDDVDAGHLPAALRKPHAPDRAAGSDVKSRAIGWPVLVLLASDELHQLVGEGQMLSEVSQGWKPIA